MVVWAQDILGMKGVKSKDHMSASVSKERELSCARRARMNRSKNGHNTVSSSFCPYTSALMTDLFVLKNDYCAFSVRKAPRTFPYVERPLLALQTKPHPRMYTTRRSDRLLAALPNASSWCVLASQWYFHGLTGTINSHSWLLSCLSSTWWFELVDLCLRR